MPMPGITALALLLLGLASPPAQAQVMLNPGAVGKISFATEPITGQSSGVSSAVFGTVDGYTNQLISAGHGFANLGAPTDVSNISGSITNQSLSSNASGPSPFGSGQVAFSAGTAGMGYGVLWSSYSLNGAPSAPGLVSLTRANGNALFTNTSGRTLEIQTGVYFGLQGNIGSNNSAGGALATSITVGGSTFTPYVAIGFNGSAATGFVEPGFVGAAAPGADSWMNFQESNGTFLGEGSILYEILLLAGETLGIDTTLTLFGTGSDPVVPTPPINWRNVPPGDPQPDATITSQTPTDCPPTPEPGSVTLGLAPALLMAALCRKRLWNACRRSTQNWSAERK